MQDASRSSWCKPMPKRLFKGFLIPRRNSTIRLASVHTWKQNSNYLPVLLIFYSTIFIFLSLIFMLRPGQLDSSAKKHGILFCRKLLYVLLWTAFPFSTKYSLSAIPKLSQCLVHEVIKDCDQLVKSDYAYSVNNILRPIFPQRVRSCKCSII